MLELIFIVIAYLMGSLSGSSIVSHLFKLQDPRQSGSKNPGATNMLRVNGRIPGLLVLIFDMLKGMIPVYLAYRYHVNTFFLGIIAISATLGHIFPCFHRFQGGKGIATALGIVILINLNSSLLIIFTWILTLITTGYSSVAAIITCIFASFFVWFVRPEFTLPVSMLCCLIILRHISNITRLIDHRESKIYKRKKKRSKIEFL